MGANFFKFMGLSALVGYYEGCKYIEDLRKYEGESNCVFEILK